MAEEQRKSKRFLWIGIGSYFLIIAGYCFGKAVGEGQGLEYRFWTDTCFRIWVWFAPILFAGIMLLKTCIRKWQQKSSWRWMLSILLICYVGAALYFSFIYVLINAFTMTSDEKMPDGNLVVAESRGLESIHHYAEPIGLFFRRDFSFDEERTAKSLSKIYGVDFRPLREENGQWVYASDAYPGVEVTNILYGFTEASYLDNDFELMLTSKMLKEHQEVFASHGVELVSFLYGQTEWNPEGKGICTAVLVSEENKERAAEAIAAFIKVTLQEDLRPDGKSIWDCVDGSIFLVTDTKEEGEYQSIRNIPFGLSPEYTWIYGEGVTATEIVEEIVIKHETDDETVDALPESVEEDADPSETAEYHTETEENNTTEEISHEILEDYLSREPSCVFVTEGGMEYRMVAVDRALGSSFYVLIGTKDQGKTCAFFNSDPYNSSGGEARWLTFMDENLGFTCLAHSAGTYGSLYRTEDGGISWEETDYPSAMAKLPDGTCYNPFVMPEKVYEEDGILFIEAGQGADGDFYDEKLSFCHGLYRSEDQGISWEFSGYIPVVRE